MEHGKTTGARITGVAEDAAEQYLFERGTFRAAALICVSAGGRFTFDADAGGEYILLAEPEGARVRITENGVKSLSLC